MRIIFQNQEERDVEDAVPYILLRKDAVRLEFGHFKILSFRIERTGRRASQTWHALRDAVPYILLHKDAVLYRFQA